MCMYRRSNDRQQMLQVHVKRGRQAEMQIPVLVHPVA